MDRKADSKLKDLDKRFDKVLEYFTCPICLSELHNTYVTTKCAHRFCEDCIRRTMEQFRKCPLCNTNLTSYSDLVKDSGFDGLKEEFKIFKEQKMEATFAKLLEENGPSGSKKEFSPLEKIVKSYLLNSLMVHERYTNQMKANYLKEIARIDKQTNDFLLTIRDACKDRKEFELKARIVIENADIEKSDLRKDLDSQLQSVATRYEKYLEQNMFTPLNLPVKIKIRIPNKNLKFTDFEFQPSDDIKEMFNYLVKETDKSGDKIVEFSSDVIILNFGSFGNYSNEEATSVYKDYLMKRSLPREVELVRTKNCLPVLELAIKPGSEFFLFGQIKFESDTADVCFKYLFDKSDPKPVDYYQCFSCSKTKWICKACKKNCHSGHDIREFSMKHKPSWACCDCFKTKECCFHQEDAV